MTFHNSRKIGKERQTMIVLLESFYQSVRAVPLPFVSTSMLKNNVSLEIVLEHH